MGWEWSWGLCRELVGERLEHVARIPTMYTKSGLCTEKHNISSVLSVLLLVKCLYTVLRKMKYMLILKTLKIH